MWTPRIATSVHRFNEKTHALGGIRSGLGGEPCRTRTYNLEIKSLLLYQLS